MIRKLGLLLLCLSFLAIIAEARMTSMFYGGQTIAGGGVADPTDQFSANPVFSVGVTATELDNEGTITVASNIATFSIAFPPNVGAGDVVQYDVDNNGTVDNDEYGIIHGISTDRLKAYLLKTNGGNVVNTTATTSVYDIFRAYISLVNWESGTENTNIDADCRDDYGLTDDDLTDADDEDGPLYVTCYADGNDTTKVIIANTWITDTDDFIKIYTPILTPEVGTSQRHSGTWGTGYKLVFDDGYDFVIDCNASYVRFEGLQMHNLNANGNSFRFQGAGEFYFSHNILWGTPGTSNDNSLMLEDMGISTVKIWNNILYSLHRGIYYSNGIAGSTFVIYNNTVVDIAQSGITISDGVGDATAYVKNNLVFNTADDYSLTAFTARNYNYNMGEDDDSGSQDSYVITAQAGTAIFEDYNNDDFHIVASSNATDVGIDLSSDGNLTVTDDIDMVTRAGTWDIGADED